MPKIVAKIHRLVNKANCYAIRGWDNTVFAAPEIVGYSAKGKRIMRRVDRLVQLIG
jgi:hypothetical protein